MKTISRGHRFENRLTLVNQCETVYGLHHESDIYSLTVKRTPELDAAFDAQNWEAFEAAEAAELGGEVSPQVRIINPEIDKEMFDTMRAEDARRSEEAAIKACPCLPSSLCYRYACPRYEGTRTV